MTFLPLETLGAHSGAIGGHGRWRANPGLLALLVVLAGCTASDAGAGPVAPPTPPDPSKPNVPNPNVPQPLADTTIVTVAYGTPLQTISGFGGTTTPLVYGGVDYLGPLRGTAIQAAFGQVGISRGLLSIGVVETPATATDVFNQRGNDNADPFVANAAGFNFGGLATLRSAVLLPAAAHGYNTVELGPFLQLRGPLDWMIGVRSVDYDRYLDEAAEYVLTVLQQWRTAYGQTPALIHLFNEPTSGNVELASTSLQEVVDLVTRVGLRLRSAGFANVKFVVPNEETMARSLAVARAILSDPVARDFVGAIGFHQYPYGSAYASVGQILGAVTGGRSAGALQDMEALRALGAQHGVPLWMTEVTEGPGTMSYPFTAIENVMARAIHIHDVFRYAGASAYFGMNTMWDSRSHAEHFESRNIPFLTEQSGMVLIDLDAGSVKVTGMGYAVGHYARWVKPGATQVTASTDNAAVMASAFRDPSSGRLVVVTINTSSAPQLLRIRINGAAATGPVTGEASHGAARWAPISASRVASDGAIEVVAPARSVLTVASSMR